MLDQVTGEARLRLYRASVHEYWILDPDDPHDVRVRSALTGRIHHYAGASPGPARPGHGGAVAAPAG